MLFVDRPDITEMGIGRSLDPSATASGNLVDSPVSLAGLEIRRYDLILLGAVLSELNNHSWPPHLDRRPWESCRQDSLHVGKCCIGGAGLISQARKVVNVAVTTYAGAVAK